MSSVDEQVGGFHFGATAWCCSEHARDGFCGYTCGAELLGLLVIVKSSEELLASCPHPLLQLCGPL